MRASLEQRTRRQLVLGIREFGVCNLTSTDLKGVLVLVPFLNCSTILDSSLGSAEIEHV